MLLSEGADAQGVGRTLKVPGATSSCLRVKWAGLYWASSLDVSRQNTAAIERIKFKVPGENSFRDLTADQKMSTVFAGHEYIYNCFKDVTSILQGVGSQFNNGEYFAGDIWSDDAKGGWGGWSLIVVYEDVSVASEYIYMMVVILISLTMEECRERVLILQDFRHLQLLQQ